MKPIRTSEVHWYSARDKPPVGLTVMGVMQDRAVGVLLVYWNGRRKWLISAYGERYRKDGVEVLEWAFLPERKDES